jgi:hypothetical protein
MPFEILPVQKNDPEGKDEKTYATHQDMTHKIRCGQQNLNYNDFYSFNNAYFLLLLFYFYIKRNMPQAFTPALTVHPPSTVIVSPVM